MAKNKDCNKKINLKKIKKRLNILSFFSIVSVSFFIVFIFLFLTDTFNLKNENKKLLEEKKVQIYNLYLGDIFKRILLLVNSTPFVDYLRSGRETRIDLESEMLNNFSHYIDEEIKGYKIISNNNNDLIFIGKESNFNLLIELCYINDKLNFEMGRCAAKLYIYFDEDEILNKIKKFDPFIEKCFKCNAFEIKNGSIINGLYISKSDNFKIKFNIKNMQNYSKIINFIIISFLVMVLICFLTFYLNHRLLNIYIYIPLTKLFNYVKNDSEKQSFILSEVNEIADKVEEFKNNAQKNEKIKQQIEFSKLASQVAHDIKSPLVALNIFFAKATQLPEDNRILVRNAIQRIQDIANSLIFKHQELNNQNKNVIEDIEPHSVQLLSSLIESLISEKRMQYREYLEIEIEGKFGVNSYGLFSRIQPKEFKRMLSNLINNAVEALNKKGNIILFLNSKNDKILFSIKDNGKGIHPYLLPKLMKRGASFGKKEGSGLGLYHAKVLSEQWGGKLELNSEVAKGTEVLLTLPKASEPTWFISTLNISFDSTIVIIDDDASIHNIWDDRFQIFLKQEYNIKIIHFSNPENVISWFTTENIENIIFLCDYEFINHKMNGLDLVSKLNTHLQTILVTSRFEEEGFREKCEKMGIKMIPKNLAYFVPIKMLPAKEKPYAILIDDDLFIHTIWRATAAEKNIRYFQSAESFMNEVERFDKSTPLYIDSHLGEGLNGEDVAKKIYEMGFRDIYLATSYDACFFPPMNWIKEIRGKEPPWFN
ncbi:sensor histidine kinase [Fluviispira multicolorata]|uniref:histidine kinase n=1 Tax=Fluviispira multicolorata TaxID=2654512 RepID=A0A833JF67_9BACT|nr:HAMP domain-containing sensor histidine kinase [Fluviispira multicolorata]KAB8033569.1 hypothetical protein GCL57_02350 [Fluviispira multicolorata]